MPETEQKRFPPRKFYDPDVTADGEKLAVVVLTHLKTIWFNTGSLCNITCRGCYMKSSPDNDQLAYITAAEVSQYLDESVAEKLPVEEIAFTGGEPFMNPEIMTMLDDSLTAGYRVLLLTNAMKPMWQQREKLLALKMAHGDRLTLRVSIDHYTRQKHEIIRGAGSWRLMMKGLKWLADHGFKLAVAGRACWNDNDKKARAGYGTMFTKHSISVDAADSKELVLFPELDENADVPEITVSCWNILGVAPETMMCATSRMVVKRKHADIPVIVPCTLLPYDARFELGSNLAGSSKTIKLNHPHCAKFCVLGGASCSADE